MGKFSFAAVPPPARGVSSMVHPFLFASWLAIASPSRIILSSTGISIHSSVPPVLSRIVISSPECLARAREKARVKAKAMVGVNRAKTVAT